jgi:hypothetical protein
MAFERASSRDTMAGTVFAPLPLTRNRRKADWLLTGGLSPSAHLSGPIPQLLKDASGLRSHAMSRDLLRS